MELEYTSMKIRWDEALKKMIENARPFDESSGEEEVETVETNEEKGI